MRYRRVRIFVPAREPYRATDWSETLLATCVRPVLAGAGASLDWWWFSRYAMPPGHPDSGGDCAFADVSQDYLWQGQGQGQAVHRSIRLTFAVADNALVAFEAALRAQFAAHGALITSLGFIDYGLDADLGGSRFFPQAAGQVAQHRRAERVARLLHAVSELLLDALEPDGAGHFATQQVPDVNNCNAHVFESPHHMFCNISGVPLDVFLVKDSRMITYFMGLAQFGVDLRPVPVPRNRVIF